VVAQNQIYLPPENQVKTMDTKPEHNAAPKVINGRINGRFAKGFSGNPGGSPEATRRAFNKRFLRDLAEDWQQHGREVFKRVRPMRSSSRRSQPIKAVSLITSSNAPTANVSKINSLNPRK
jgi:hypothetical protein